MFNPTKFQQIDSYVSALCIGALVSLSFWFVIIGSLLGIVFGQQETPDEPIHPVHYVQSGTYDAIASRGQAVPGAGYIHTDTRLS